jgi:hypothetical protein
MLDDFDINSGYEYYYMGIALLAILAICKQ